MIRMVELERRNPNLGQKISGLKKESLEPSHRALGIISDDKLEELYEIAAESTSDTDARKLFRLVIDAQRINENPKEEDLAQIFKKDGLKPKTVWEHVRRSSFSLRPVLRDLGLDLLPTKIIEGANEVTTNTFALKRYMPSNLPSTIEEIENTPTNKSDLEKPVEIKPSANTNLPEIQQEESEEMKFFKIDLTLSILSNLLNNGLKSLEKNPRNLLIEISGKNKNLRNIVSRKNKPERVQIILEFIEETVGRLTETHEEEKKEKKIISVKEQKIIDILDELFKKHIGIINIKKAISEHYGIAPEQNPTSSPETESPKA